ncbi:bifunctional enoyl-CoA hydratase/phosphate acetyltransferase [soil metagenome]
MNDITSLSEFIENRIYSEINVGDKAVLTRTLHPEDIQLFAIMSGDVNPAHVDPEYARSSMFHEVIAHGMWGAALISTVLGTEFPGPGTIYISQTLRFSRPVKVGDTMTVTITCKQKFDHNNHMILDCICTNQDGMKVISGEAEVLAPLQKIKRARMAMPALTISDRDARHRKLLAKSKDLTPVLTAFAHPVDLESLNMAVAARDIGAMVPVLVGPEAHIRALAEQNSLDLNGCRFVDVPYSREAARRAVAMAASGEVEALVQGSQRTDELLHSIIAAGGLRTTRRISHVLYIDVQTYPHPLFITDTLVNIDPSLKDKVDIVQNAIDFAHMMGVAEPKVALLAAIETVTPKMRATTDAAALCKMADRRQITGAVLDGPLGFDNAVSMASARQQGIRSLVAGQADVLVAPDLESANMLAKQFEHLSDAVSGGIAMGARVPIVLLNRSDSQDNRVASCALAQFAAHRQRTDKSLL